MAFYPLEHDFESRITDEDRELQKMALEMYSENAASHIWRKYMILEEFWPEYLRKVRELFSRKLPEMEFMRELIRLRDETPYFGP